MIKILAVRGRAKRLMHNFKETTIYTSDKSWAVSREQQICCCFPQKLNILLDSYEDLRMRLDNLFFLQFKGAHLEKCVTTLRITQHGLYTPNLLPTQILLIV